MQHCHLIRHMPCKRAAFQNRIVNCDEPIFVIFTFVLPSIQWIYVSDAARINAIGAISHLVKANVISVVSKSLALISVGGLCWVRACVC